MQQEQNRLKIHTNICPPVEPSEKPLSPELQEALKSVRWESIPHPQQRRVKCRRKPGAHSDKRPLTTGEKLLRNTAFSCALLLSVLALKNVDQPWSREATEGIRQVVNMRINWDDTLGKLSFVRALVPDTALVFLNLGSGVDMNRPVDGKLVHEFTQQQPWLEYSCAAGQKVCAALNGVVSAAGQGVGGEWIVAIQSENDTETVYGYLAEAQVQMGQRVEAGQPIGTTSMENEGRFYFEVREQGSPIDPTGRMK